MSFKRVSTLRGFRPLAFVDENTLLGARGFELLTYSITNESYESIASTGRLRKRILSKSRVLTRLLRLGFRHGIEATESVFFLRLGKEILKLDLQNRDLQTEQLPCSFHAPLSFGKIENVEGFDQQIAFGEYFHNPQLMPVSLFGWDDKSGWKKRFEFESGCINHVHSLVPDPQRNGVWILTGDFGDAAAIWFATENFRKVECVARGSQAVRACFGFPSGDGLYYCSDSPLEQNSFSMLFENPETNDWSVRHLGEMEGPVIFHGRCKSGAVFSTSVEPMPNAKTVLWSALSRKRGPGVASENSIVWHLSHDGDLTEISRNRKDMLPFLFQFGMSTFPANGERSDYIAFFNIALRKNDYSTEIWAPA